MSSSAAVTLPSVLANGPALHALVRVQLTNGTIVVGRLLEMDAATMNLKLDAITSTAVRRRQRRSNLTADNTVSHSTDTLTRSADTQNEMDTIEANPIALRCIQGMVIRGACVRFLDFIREGKDGGTSYGEVEAAAQQVRPSA
jgi:small nuclear ribonucleoprotein (snRNP)-like protein